MRPTLLAAALAALAAGPARAADAPATAAGAPDALELLWDHRPRFDARGEPVVTIRLAEGARELAFAPRAPAALVPRGAPPVAVPAGAALRARVRAGLPAAITYHVLLAELDHSDAAGLAAARATWTARGLAPVVRGVGVAYGVAGKVVDDRRTLLLAPGGSEAAARALADRIGRAHGVRPALFGDLVTRPSGRIEVLDAAGRTIASGDRVVTVDGEGFTLRGAPYRGRLHLTVDAAGRLAAVDEVGLEALLRGLVPSELPASSPPEALRAQAVTARSNVLAQLGTRHLTDPYVLCAEVHCQAYRGARAEVPATDDAVRATAGEALFDAGGALVDGVYSAVCGGHGEDNDAVWGGLPSASLRGRADLARGEAAADLSTDPALRAFLADAGDAWCAAGPRGRFRWERRLGAGELTALAAPLGVGRVSALRVLRRGVSGRALALEIAGDRRTAVVEGELRIRRLLGDLHSAMFVVDRARDGVVLRGGGWGHGAGMCQWGAVGRARAGQGYREILRAYFSGAAVAPIY